MQLNGQSADEVLSPEEQEELYQRNCETTAAATEDMHHRNLARMALMHEHNGIEVAGFDLLNMKFEILLDLIVGNDRLQRLMVGFFFQQKLAEHLDGLDGQHKHKE